MKSFTRVAVAIAAALLSSHAANARIHKDTSTTTAVVKSAMDNNGHYVPDLSSGTQTKRQVGWHRHERPVLVEKSQEYVAPTNPAVPLGTKEAHDTAQYGRGKVCSHKTGACASGISQKHIANFQALTNALEDAGATIYYMGGYRRVPCSAASQHGCGWAIDYCQDYRGHVSGARDCKLPEPAEFHRIVLANHLYDGSVWGSTDYGHVQVQETGAKHEPRGWIGNGHKHYYASWPSGVKTVEYQARRRHWHRHRLATWQHYALAP